MTKVPSAAAGALLLAAGAAAGPIPKGTVVLWPAAEVRWVPMPGGPPGAQQAALWGDFKAGEHGLLYKWPAGTVVPVHTHTYGEHASVVAGTLTLAVDGAAPKELGPGSYFSMAGGTRHATTCKAGADCVFILHREGPFDAVMVEAAKK